ncbi:MAG: DJ-1/PfpI family protein [Clostridia bacterium]|nr:DJ-1/PfpI family protein [Clostridia bacterium]
MVYLFLADGFEEVEALTPLDLLRRAGAEIQTVGVTGKAVTGSHGITVTADITTDEMVLDSALEMIILPGGMPGTSNLDRSAAVHDAIRYAAERGITIGAICAAPSIIGKLGLLTGRSAICYPGFEKYLVDANISAKSVVTDENFITAKGMGVALQFGLTLVTALYGEEVSDKIRASVQA